MTTKIIFSKPRQKKYNHQQDSNQIKSQQPIIPINKVSLDVIKKIQNQPYPHLNLATHSTITDALELYYNQYVRLFKQNQTLNDQLASILLERNNLADQFNQIKKMKSYDDNIRRRRRYASQIQRNYHCPMPKCNKGYGSQGSLTHHVRLKHPKFFQSGQYEIYLQTYILPKQQIKNEDKDGKPLINVQQINGDPSKLVKQNKKTEIVDDNVKQAKQQENEKNKSKQKSKKNNGKEITVLQKTEYNNIKVPQTPLMQSLMREVDGYIVLEDQNNSICSQKSYIEQLKPINNEQKQQKQNGKQTENNNQLS